MLVKTPEQILARIKAVEDCDWMGVQVTDLLSHLPFADAQPHLKPETTEVQWQGIIAKTLAPLDAIRDYLPFAWGKANNRRGLSAGRSLDHIQTWLWLAGHDDIVQRYYQGYEHYGKFQLVLASEIVGFDWAAHDDKQWVTDEFASGLPDSEREAQIERARTIAKEITRD